MISAQRNGIRCVANVYAWVSTNCHMVISPCVLYHESDAECLGEEKVSARKPDKSRAMGPFAKQNPNSKSGKEWKPSSCSPVLLPELIFTSEKRIVRIID